MKKLTLNIFILQILIITNLSGGNNILKEDFYALDKWTPLYFPKINNHSKYSIVKENAASFLKSEADNSASGIIHKDTFDPYRYPYIKWRWKISNVYKKGNAKKKSGDDYPIRIYVMFKYDPDNASLVDKAKYNAAKLIYGEYPPHSTLSYIWANQNHPEKYLTSQYTDMAKMILVEKGPENAGKWIDARANILVDYKRAFKRLPPKTACLAVMSDADNTGERATAFIDYIILSEDE